MAKMFYSIEEVCEKLDKSEDEVKEMVKSGQIQEFRDRDKLMFKVDQIDLLAGGDEDDDEEMQIPMEDTGASASGIALADSSTGDSSASSQSDSREGTGISVFDTDHGEEELGDEASEATQIGETIDDELNLESVGSGSGLLDLTRESDETAVGAELLEDAYSSEDDNIDIPANASGLFEASSEEIADERAAFGGQPTTGVMMVEVYDGGGSGLGVGLLLGAAAALICVAIIGMVGVTGATPQLAMSFAENLWIWVGALGGVTLIFGLIGWFIGRASE